MSDHQGHSSESRGPRHPPLPRNAHARRPATRREDMTTGSSSTAAHQRALSRCCISRHCCWCHSHHQERPSVCELQYFHCRKKASAHVSLARTRASTTAARVLTLAWSASERSCACAARQWCRHPFSKKCTSALHSATSTHGSTHSPSAWGSARWLPCSS